MKGSTVAFTRSSISARLVPKDLDLAKTTARRGRKKMLDNVAEHPTNIKSIITSVETCVYGYNVESRNCPTI